MKWVWPPLIEAIKNRKEQIQNQFNKIDNDHKELESKKKDVNHYVQEKQKKAKDIISNARHMHDQIINQAKKAAKNEYDNIINQAKEQVLFEKNRMSKELRKEVVSLTVATTKKIIGSSSKDLSYGNKDIVEDFISSLHDKENKC